MSEEHRFLSPEMNSERLAEQGRMINEAMEELATALRAVVEAQRPELRRLIEAITGRG